MKLPALCSCLALLLYPAMAAPETRDDIDDLKTKIITLSSFDFEDADSNNRQTLEFKDDCSVKLTMTVSWFGGGTWSTTYEFHLKDLLVDQIRISVADDSKPTGINLETRNESIVIHEERDRRRQTGKTYLAFIRLQNPDDAVQVFLAFKSLAIHCGATNLE